MLCICGDDGDDNDEDVGDRLKSVKQKRKNLNKSKINALTIGWIKNIWKLHEKNVLKNIWHVAIWFEVNWEVL